MLDLLQQASSSATSRQRPTTPPTTPPTIAPVWLLDEDEDCSSPIELAEELEEKESDGEEEVVVVVVVADAELDDGKGDDDALTGADVTAAVEKGGDELDGEADEVEDDGAPLAELLVVEVEGDSGALPLDDGKEADDGMVGGTEGDDSDELPE